MNTNGTPVVELNDPKLISRAYDLGLKIVSNVKKVLTLDELEYWESHLAEIPVGLARFANRQPENVCEPKEVAVHASFKIADIDLIAQLAKAEAFAKKYFGLEVKLSEVFELPVMVPWKSVLPVFVPAGMDNRKVFELLKELGLNPWEEVDVMKYTNSEASDKHQLFLTNNSERPDKETMGLSPDSLRKTQKSFLNLKGYGLAMSFYHETTEGYLDPKTITWFPEDRLPDGDVAGGCWGPDNRKVWFDWCGPDCENDSMGARLAIRVSLKP